MGKTGDCQSGLVLHWRGTWTRLEKHITPCLTGLTRQGLEAKPELLNSMIAKGRQKKKKRLRLN